MAPVLNAIAVPRVGPGRPRKRSSCLRVDKAYGAHKSRQLLQGRGIRCICPERKDARKHRLKRGSRGGSPPSFNPDEYKGRNVVERAINRLKDFRAVATRYDKRGYNYLAVVTVATIVLWLL
jgi:transposase